MIICNGIQKVPGGFIVCLPTPYADYSDDCQVVCKTWAEVMERLEQVANLKDHERGAGG